MSSHASRVCICSCVVMIVSFSLTVRSCRARHAVLPRTLRAARWGVVGAVLDHVQEPAVARARYLGDLQPRREVVPPPDQGRGNGDPCQVRRRDRRYPELLHEGAESGLYARCAGTVEVVRLERLPALAHPLAQTAQIERAVLPEVVVCALGRLREEVVQCEPEVRRWLEPIQAER